MRRCEPAPSFAFLIFGRANPIAAKPKAARFAPATVGVRISKPNGDDVLMLFPITSQQPQKDRFAAEIPDIEKRRAGLDVSIQLWIVLDEYNQDVIGRSFYLKPEPSLGYFSKAFLLPLLRKLIARRSKAKAVHRSG